MDDSKSKSEGVAANKEVPKGSEEVLIEIDGKFELVSAADMQANQPTDPRSTQHPEANNVQDQAAIKKSHDDHVNFGAGGKEKQRMKKSDKKQEHSAVENYDDDFEGGSCTSSAPSVDNVGSNIGKSTPQPSVDPREQTKPHVSEPASVVAYQNEDSDSNKPSGDTTAAIDVKDSKANTVGDSQTELRQRHSSVEIIVSEHNVRRVGRESTCTNKSTSTGRSRTKSAPDSRSTQSQYWDEDEVDKRLMCENAFKAWLAKKDAQISEERKLQRANTSVLTREEKLQKIEMCENAYKAWLENKNRQVHERRYHQRAKSASTGTSNEPQQSTAAFRYWLEQKQIQRQKEKTVEIRRVKEEAVLAQKVEPSIANQAYRR